MEAELEMKIRAVSDLEEQSAIIRSRLAKTLEDNQNLTHGKESQIQALNSQVEEQKQLMESTLQRVQEENCKQLSELELTHDQKTNHLKSEIETYKTHTKDLNTKYAKLKQRFDDGKEELENANKTIADMNAKQNDLMREIDNKIVDLKTVDEKWASSLNEVHEKKETIKKEIQRYRKENQNLRELVKLKDTQIEDQLNSDNVDKSQTDHLKDQVKNLKTQVAKREMEIKEVVKSLRVYSDQCSQLKVDLEKAQKENDSLIGHK